MQWMQATRVVVEANLGKRGETFVKVPQQLPELLIGNRIWVLLVPCVPYLGKPDPIEVGEDRPSVCRLFQEHSPGRDKSECHFPSRW